MSESNYRAFMLQTFKPVINLMYISNHSYFSEAAHMNKIKRIWRVCRTRSGRLWETSILKQK